MPAALRRRIVLGALLLSTLGATYWASRLDQAEPAPNVGKKRRVQVAADRTAQAVKPGEASEAAGPVDDLLLVRREDYTGNADDLFASRSWRPPPPPAPPPVVIKPTAPPLPFKYVGRLEEGDGQTVFLSQGNGVRTVKAGDTLDGSYRVDAITPAGVEFTYLPLNEKQFMGLYR